MNTRQKTTTEVKEEPEVQAVENTAGVGNQPQNRPKRTPIAERNVLKYKQREGYVRRVVNDYNADGTRLKAFQDAGYTFVNKKDQDETSGGIKETKQGQAVSKSVGGGIRGYLMEIPKELYEEDKLAKQKAIDAVEEGMRREESSKPDKHTGQYGKLEIGR